MQYYAEISDSKDKWLVPPVVLVFGVFVFVIVILLILAIASFLAWLGPLYYLRQLLTSSADGIPWFVELLFTFPLCAVLSYLILKWREGWQDATYRKQSAS